MMMMRTCLARIGTLLRVNSRVDSRRVRVQAVGEDVADKGASACVLLHDAEQVAEQAEIPPLLEPVV